MQLRVKPSAWITVSGLSPACTLSTARIRISCNVLWSKGTSVASFNALHCILCILTYDRLISSSALNPGMVLLKAEPDVLLLFRSQLQIFRKSSKFLLHRLRRMDMLKLLTR